MRILCDNTKCIHNFYSVWISGNFCNAGIEIKNGKCVTFKEEKIKKEEEKQKESVDLCNKIEKSRSINARCGLEGTKIDNGSHRMSDGFHESEFGDYHKR